VKLRLREEDFIKGRGNFHGRHPDGDERGSFIINGPSACRFPAHRSPGICFESPRTPNGKLLHSFRHHPDAAVARVQFDKRPAHVYLTAAAGRKFLSRRCSAPSASATTWISSPFYTIQD